MSYGWLTEATILPQKERQILQSDDKSALAGLKALVGDRRNAEANKGPRTNRQRLLREGGIDSDEEDAEGIVGFNPRLNTSVKVGISAASSSSSRAKASASGQRGGQQEGTHLKAGRERYKQEKSRSRSRERGSAKRDGIGTGDKSNPKATKASEKERGRGDSSSDESSDPEKKEARRKTTLAEKAKRYEQVKKGTKEVDLEAESTLFLPPSAAERAARAFAAAREADREDGAENLNFPNPMTLPGIGGTLPSACLNYAGGTASQQFNQLAGSSSSGSNLGSNNGTSANAAASMMTQHMYQLQQVQMQQWMAYQGIAAGQMGSLDLNNFGTHDGSGDGSSKPLGAKARFQQAKRK
ncbi:unnamed protein product [Amoebophrya sp. A25]|nr:unnamed protein product [Amoebophrya sp. A25]|eukprot:GSA25T00005152001.1